MLVEARDSAMPPSAAQVAQFAADGVAVWAGYLPLRGRAGPYHQWSRADFDRLAAGGIRPLGLMFPGADPQAAADLVKSWGHTWVGMDIEPGGANTSEVVSASAVWASAGLYRGGYVHWSEWARWEPYFDALWVALYVTTPPTTAWPTRDPYGRPMGRPVIPCGWQWRNTHPEHGLGVDSSLLEDTFGATDLTPPTPPNPAEELTVAQIDDITARLQRIEDATASLARSLAVKQTTIRLPAGAREWISGPAGWEQFHVIAQEVDAVVDVIAYDYQSGAVVGQATFKLTGNVPKVRGPIPAQGAVSDLFGAPGPCSLFVTTTAPISVTLA